jgi:tetratricopeptide (TPR) repeat protein
LYREEGDYASALPQYEALARLDPYTAVNFHRLGISYHFLNRMREAATAYARAIRLDPRDWKSHMNLGLVDAALGNNNAAIEHCQRAVSLNPDAPAAHANLGVAYDAGGNRAEAEAAYRRSLALQPAQPAVQTNLANNLLAQKRPQDALPILRGVTETSDSPLARRRYGDALAMSGRDDEAAAQYRRALATDARYYPAMNALASLLMTQYRKGLLLDDRKRDEAVAMWRQSLEINPKQPRVQEQLKAWQPQAG